jgi:PAS domain S-box-containing protein
MQTPKSSSPYYQMISPSLKKSPMIIGPLSVVTGTLVLIGWVFHISILKTVVPGFASMKVNTAIEFILLGIALFLTQFPVKKIHLIVLTFLYSLIIINPLITLLQTVFQFNLGIDQLFITDTTSINLHLPYPGRMSPITAVGFVLFGFAFLGFAIKSNFAHIIAQYLLNIVTAISSIALIGYFYGLSEFYRLGFTGSLAIHTAFLLFFTSLSLSSLYSSIGINKLFTGEQIGNILAKRLLIVAVCITCFFGILSVIGKQFKLFSFNNGLSILIICFICAGFIMVWYMAKWMNKLDKSRRDAEGEIIIMNEQLELRVKERSQKLIDLLAKYRETEAKFKAAFEHSAIGMAFVSLKGKWLQVNRSLCDMMGYKEQELLSMSFESENGDNRLPYGDLEKELLTTGINDGRIERRYRCKDGSIVWISVNTVTVTNKKGGAIYFVSQFEDITNRKTAELNLKAAYKDIENHVKTIQEVTWKQSHLIRRPVANLQGLTDLLKDNYSDSQVLRHMEKELEALDKIIIEMAEEAACNGIKKIMVKKRSFK